MLMILFYSQKRLYLYKIKEKLSYLFTDSLMYKSNTNDVHEDFIKDKEMFDCSIYSAKPNYYDYSNKLVVGKIK